jgi:hypothetical protein
MSTTEYVILLHGDPQAWRDYSPAQRAENMARHDAFSRECAEQGYVITGGRELTDAAAATVVRRRPDGGAPVVSEGPFAETVEQLGGFYVIETDDFDGLVALVAHHLEEDAEIRASVRQDDRDADDATAGAAAATAGVAS